MKKIFILLMVTFLLVGCSTSTDSTTSSTDDTANENNVLTLARTSDLQSLDFAVASDSTSFEMMAQLFDGLVIVRDNNEIDPGVAKSWDISDDKTVYTFYLDENYKWSNGTPVTANDFVYAWQRMTDPEEAAVYSFIFKTVKLKNVNEVMSGELPVDELGVKALDDYTLEVTLDAPVPFFLSLTGFPTFYPLNEEFVESKGDQYATSIDNLLFNGPFVLTEWNQGSSYVFERNENYAYADEVLPDGLVYKFLADAQTAVLSYETGDIDILTISGDMVDLYKDDPDFENYLVAYTWYLAFNFNIPELNNVNLRNAFAYAINRDDVANLILKDGSVAADGIIPREFAYSPDGVDFREDTDSYFGTDYALAQEYLEKAKEELGVDTFEIKLLFDDSDSSKSVAEFIKSELESNLPGVTINLDQKSKKGRTDQMSSGDYEIALDRWGADYADPQTFLDLYTSDTTTYHKSLGYSSAAYDADIQEAFYGESTKDDQARWDLMKDAERVLLEDDVALIPIYQTGLAYLISPDISNYGIYTMAMNVYQYTEINR